MYMKMPKPTNAELVMMVLNQWVPVYGINKDSRFYQVDAEEIAQQFRKNSSPGNVEKVVSKTIIFRTEFEGIEGPFEEHACRKYG